MRLFNERNHKKRKCFCVFIAANFIVDSLFSLFVLLTDNKGIAGSKWCVVTIVFCYCFVLVFQGLLHDNSYNTGTGIFLC